MLGVHIFDVGETLTQVKSATHVTVCGVNHTCTCTVLE